MTRGARVTTGTSRCGLQFREPRRPLDVRWIHGARTKREALDPKIQVHAETTTRAIRPGGRVLEVLGSPGHHKAAITAYDPWTGVLLTGDTVLPGRLFAFDFPADLATLDRLVDFAGTRTVTHVLGCRVQMTSRPGRAYPLGATCQPDERALPALTAVADRRAGRPGVGRVARPSRRPETGLVAPRRGTWNACRMSSLPSAFAEDVIHLPLRAQFEVFLDEHRATLNGCLDGLTEEQVRRSLVPSRTTLLGLVKHATFVEKVWFDEAVTCRSRAEIGIPATPDESFILDDDDTIATVRRAHREACESSRRATSFLGLDDMVHGNRRGPLPLRWVYLHMLRELAQHCGHADILREQILS